MQPKFLYFDLGKVLVDFSYDQMLAQIGAVAGIEAEAARAALFDGDLLRHFETGRLSAAEFYEAFCAATGSRPDFAALAAAASEIFWINLPMLPLVAQLQQAGYRMGILSNTLRVALGLLLGPLSHRGRGVRRPRAKLPHRRGQTGGGHLPRRRRTGRRAAGGNLLRRRHAAARRRRPQRWVSTPCSSPRPRHWRPNCAGEARGGTIERAVTEIFQDTLSACAVFSVLSPFLSRFPSCSAIFFNSTSRSMGLAR